MIDVYWVAEAIFLMAGVSVVALLSLEFIDWLEDRRDDND